jgi:uncharacterized protein with NAD-binding domain and iron-sulfur cluster
MAKRKIAILGGGMGSLTTAFWLTDRPNWRDDYEVTIYALGWRLGGKCASSREPETGRISEHGLHVWYGWYANAFRTLRRCYAELDRPAGSPLASIDDAFTGRSHVQILEEWPVGSKTYSPWNIDMPPSSTKPGLAPPETGFWHVIAHVLGVLIKELELWMSQQRTAPPPEPGIAGAVRRALRVFGFRSTVLHAAWRTAEMLHATPRAERHEHARRIHSHLGAFHAWMHGEGAAHADKDPAVRRLMILADLGITIVRGLIADDVRTKGLSSIDGEELCAWLRRHGASELLLQSTLIRALYDAWFAYTDGVPDEAHRDIAAGVGVGAVIRTHVLYEGELLYLMTAGMGDAVIAPLYEVLARRGVKFEFFSRVDALELSSDRKRIAKIRISRQATVKHGRYEPLIAVASLPCWPAQPRYEQLVEGDELCRRNIDLESHWTDWKPVAHYELVDGEHFDDVVLGISLGGLRPICRELVEADRRWRDMLDRIPAIQTMSVQVWLTKSLTEMGWRGPARPSVGSPEGLSVWADMSHTLGRETWPYGCLPRGILYLCGTMPATEGGPAVARAAVRAEAIRWFGANAGWIWPASGEGGGKALDWANLLAPDGMCGSDRIDAQVIRANVDPTELYVLSPTGTTQLRLEPGHSGFANLVCAGDWTRTPIGAGCVEATTMSGMLASRALCNHPAEVWGERFLVG